MFQLVLPAAFATVVLAYLFSEYLLARFDVRRRVLIGDGWPLITILCANAVSLVVILVSSVVALLAIGADLHDFAYAALVCLCAQSVWLTQHLWFYHRYHLRLRYE